MTDRPAHSAVLHTSVLLVDDQPANLLALEEMLADLGHKLVRAHSGAEALRYVLDQDFAVILLDVRMPDLDGLETARLIRNRSRSKVSPIIFLSAYDDQESVSRAYELGAVDFLIKPVVPQILKAKVSGFAELFRKTKQAEDNARRLLEEEVARQTAEKYAQVFKLVHSVAKIGHWEWNALTDENKWSPELEALYGLPPGGFEGGYQGWVKLLHPEDVARAEVDVRRAFETGNYFTEFRVIWPDGSIHWLEARAKVFKNTQGQAERIIGVNMDVTERKQVEEALKEGDRRKNEFLATLAHELRNPLAPIRNGLELMKRADGDSSLIAQARTIVERQVQHLVRLIDDLLDISRITRGKVQLRKEEVPLAAVIQGAVEASRPHIAAQAHELTVTLPPEAIYLDADPTRLAQVFTNLLGNSAKYMEKCGHIWLTARCQDGAVAVSLLDTGIGIAAEHLPHVFDMFSQVEPARSQEGLGIGLALARGLVELHGGTIEARSDGPGKGSEFIVRLPLTKPRPAISSNPSSIDEKATLCPQRRILVADDNLDAAESLAMMLRLMKHEVRTAHDGVEAVQAAATFRPDVVVLDIGMPKINGYETARHIRRQPWGKSIVLIAQTGWGQEVDRRRATEAGFDHHLTKPVEPATLETLLAKNCAHV